MAGFRDRGVTSVGQRVIPHPAVTLALEFGSGPLIVDDAAGRQQRGSLVAGLGFGSDALWVRGENFEAVQVRLSPAIARAVLDVSPGDLNGAVVTLADVWGRQAAQVREQLCHASSWKDRFAFVDALLADRWQAGSRTAGSAVDPEVAWAWKRILVSRGRVRVDRLAAEVGWSRKRLWYRFYSQIGAAPKRAAKLVRFDHAIHRLAAGENAARVAADCGYADQSHLHRDVVAFTGSAPATAIDQPWLAVDDIAWPDPEARQRTAVVDLP
ncbi:helix-turn-helix domain-containing protein [Micromonospora sp. FIMYZ51]|uniref:AraC family transcriptional regulator n=1 Tax=Micromonospora sp. FIMYZ51 TaxID=3051832 RepID=UPI00311DCE55